MIKFNEEQLAYIKNEMARILEIWDTGSKEELQEYIELIGGVQFDTVLMLSRNDWFLFNENNINTNKYYNELVSSFFWDGLGAWAYREHYCITAADVFELVEDEMYCEIYELLVSTWEKEDEDAEDGKN